MDRKRLLRRLAHGDLQNIRFSDMMNLIEGFGFQLVRVSGSHHLLNHSEIPGLVNLQSVRGQAEPYQIRQFLRTVEKYNLRLRE